MIQHHETTSYPYPNRIMPKTVRKFLAGKAIGLAILAGGAEAAVPSAAQAGEKRAIPAETVRSAIHKLEDVEKGDKLRVLTGKTGNILIKPGATLLTEVDGRIKRIKTEDPVQVFHGLHIRKNGEDATAFYNGDNAYVVPLTYAGNQDNIREYRYNKDGLLRSRPFDECDITHKTVEVDLVDNGYAYTFEGANRNTGEIDGQYVVPLANGVNG